MSENNHNWTFSNFGGMSRINIVSGEDIAHLGELDQKLWTVLSCPASGLEFNSRALEILDSDKDGNIHANEVIAAAKWLTGSLKDPEMLIKEEKSISAEAFNAENEDGAKLLEAAKQVSTLIKAADAAESVQISTDDADAAIKILTEKMEQQKKDAIAAQTNDSIPYGDASDAVLAAFLSIGKKIDDYFIRCSLSKFDSASREKLDVSAEKIAAISDKDTNGCWSEIAAYPLVHIAENGKLPLNEVVNPAWAKDFNTLKESAFSKDYPKADDITEEEWKAVAAKLNAYNEWKTNAAGKGEEATKESQALIDSILKLKDFIILYSCFYKFLRNYITFNDFYTAGEELESTFQAGKLYIDQRCCNLCIRVNDISKHDDISIYSGMFLIYCNCKSKELNKEMTIAAAITTGDINNLRLGKNGIFYDRNGNDWDATVIKIIDNPISIRQAFWSPYRKFWQWCNDKINKAASDRESQAIGSLTEKAEKATTDLKTAAETQAAGAKPIESSTEKKQAFDIAKFAGIFAAIGLAIGYITDAIVKTVQGISQEWYYPIIFVAGIILVISGPSVFIAWGKLRKRNLAPLLNANGWAVNAASLISILFGATLTTQAKYPRVELIDPIAAKAHLRAKRRTIFWIVLILLLALAAVALWLLLKYNIISCPCCCSWK